MLLMIGRVNTVDHIGLSGYGVVRVQLDHEVFWWNGVRTVYLNLVVALTVGVPQTCEQASGH